MLKILVCCVCVRVCVHGCGGPRLGVSSLMLSISPIPKLLFLSWLSILTTLEFSVPAHNCLGSLELTSLFPSPKECSVYIRKHNTNWSDHRFICGLSFGWNEHKSILNSIFQRWEESATIQVVLAYFHANFRTGQDHCQSSPPFHSYLWHYVSSNVNSMGLLGNPRENMSWSMVSKMAGRAMDIHSEVASEIQCPPLQCFSPQWVSLPTAGPPL